MVAKGVHMDAGILRRLEIQRLTRLDNASIWRKMQT